MFNHKRDLKGDQKRDISDFDDFRPGPERNGVNFKKLLEECNNLNAWMHRSTEPDKTNP